MVVLSKIATNDLHGENSPYFDGWKAYGMNPYHHGSYSDGSCRKSDWIRKTPKASICTAEGVNEFKNIAIFQDYHGLPEFRQAVASFMGRLRGGRVKFDPDRIVMGGGATGANELIMFCLADPIAQLYLFCMFPGSAKQNMISSFAPVAPPPMTMRSGSNLTRPPLTLPIKLATA